MAPALAAGNKVPVLLSGWQSCQPCHAGGWGWRQVARDGDCPAPRWQALTALAHWIPDIRNSYAHHGFLTNFTRENFLSALQDQAPIFLADKQGDLERQDATGSGDAAKTSLKLSCFTGWREKQLLWAERQVPTTNWVLVIPENSRSGAMGKGFPLHIAPLLIKLSANTSMLTNTDLCPLHRYWEQAKEESNVLKWASLGPSVQCLCRGH